MPDHFFARIAKTAFKSFVDFFNHKVAVNNPHGTARSIEYLVHFHLGAPQGLLCRNALGNVCSHIHKAAHRAIWFKQGHTHHFQSMFFTRSVVAKFLGSLNLACFEHQIILLYARFRNLWRQEVGYTFANNFFFKTACK